MSDFDMDSVGLRPGIYHAEIKTVAEKTSRSSGSRMWVVTFQAIDFGEELCTDNFMLEGGGAKLTKGKLSGLGFAKDEKVGSDRLFGKRCWVAVHEEEFNGNVNLRIDISAAGSKCGIYSNEPPGVMKPSAPGPFTAPGEDTPF